LLRKYEENLKLEDFEFLSCWKGAITHTCFLQYARVWYNFLENFKGNDFGL